MKSCLVCNTNHELMSDVRAVQELISAQETLYCACLGKHITSIGWGEPLTPGTALGAGQLRRTLHTPAWSSTDRFLTDLLWFSVWCLLNRCAHLFPTLSRVWQNEQMLQCKGVAGRARLAQGLCSPVALEPQLVTLTRLFLVFAAFVCIHLNCT